MKTIVILGPESTGKTTLAEQLSKHLKAVYIPEYARTYVENLSCGYTYDDVETIAKRQVADFKEAIAKDDNSAKYLVMDTFLIVTKVWFLHVFHRCPLWLQPELEMAQIDLFLLCKPDIPWVDDPVRENPHLREYLYEWYKNELISLNATFVEIGGAGNSRTKHALQAIKTVFR
ncbi:MAG: ATP-binding protein [Prevotellaceae bacterium]|jgi:NadR type nicotinamide-nucleotide adenylyltransferase|nr:ATP-binding protein [Prevotellaceae bacterium]